MAKSHQKIFFSSKEYLTVCDSHLRLEASLLNGKNPHPLPDLFYCCLKNILKLSKQFRFRLDLDLLISSHFIIALINIFAVAYIVINKPQVSGFNS